MTRRVEELSEDARKNIAALYGQPQYRTEDIAERYDISKASVRRIASRFGIGRAVGRHKWSGLSPAERSAKCRKERGLPPHDMVCKPCKGKGWVNGKSVERDAEGIPYQVQTQEQCESCAGTGKRFGGAT